MPGRRRIEQRVNEGTIYSPSCPFERKKRDEYMRINICGLGCCAADVEETERIRKEKEANNSYLSIIG
jgi:hypothetical protein